MDHDSRDPDSGEAKVIPLSTQRRPRAKPRGNYTYACCNGERITFQLRETHLPWPGGCNAVGGDPRTAGPSMAVTRCGHVTTGWTSGVDFEEVGPRLRLKYVEDGGWADGNTLWGRLCDGPPGEAATGRALEQLREGWRTLLGCWRTGIHCDAPLLPHSRFEPVTPGAWRARPQVADDTFVTELGALAVASGWNTFGAENVPEAGYERHLRPLGLTYDRGTVSGALPEDCRDAEQGLVLRREAWLRVLEAYLVGT